MPKEGIFNQIVTKVAKWGDARSPLVTRLRQEGLGTDGSSPASHEDQQVTPTQAALDRLKAPSPTSTKEEPASDSSST
ncbi:hypothetical protein KA082_00665 [Candidatus Woesebacteria bacterium]|nr:hypothetical protein [Candidatus Woesebacteria bacterium]